MADGKVWMTENLKLTNATLNSSSSNLPTGATFSLPASSTARWCTTSNSTNCDGAANVLDATDTSISGQSSAQSNYGVYYNWFAATAGEGTYDKSSGSVSRDICPKGWRLPTVGSSGGFQGLYNAGYNTTSLMQKTTGGPAFVLSGYRYGSSTDNQGSSGLYWSSTAINNNGAYSLVLNSSSVSPAYNNRKYGGFSVRCLAQ